MGGPRQFCTFSVAGLFFGVPVDQVQEVVRHRESTPVPLAPSVVTGLMNLRGEIVSVIDLRRRLGFTDPQTDTPRVNVVLRYDGGLTSLLVDEIGTVLEVDQEAFEALPETAGPAARELIDGVYKLPGALLHVLDVERVLKVAAGDEMASLQAPALPRPVP